MEAEAIVPIPGEIQTLIANLDTQKTLITNLSSICKTLTEHYASVEKALTAGAKSLDLAFETLESETQQAVQALDEREASIPSLESAAAGDLQSRRDSIISEIESQTITTSTDIRSILQWFCRRMDASSFWRCCSANKKDMNALRQDISSVLEEAVDPVRLVVDALDDFVTNEKERQTDHTWVFAMMLRPLHDKEAAASVSERAAEVAVKWRAQFGERMEREIEGDGEAEGQLFLQIVGLFRAHERFEKEYLEKIFMIHGKRRELAKYAQVMGIADKVGEMVAKMANTGKEIEAIYIAHEVGIMDQISSPDLLKSYLQKSKDKASAFLKKGKGSPASVESANNLENNSFKAVIKCVETCKLESKFNISGMKKKVAFTERERAEKKKMQAFNNPFNNKKQNSPVPFASQPVSSNRVGCGSTPAYPPPAPFNGSGPRRFGDYSGYKVSSGGYGSGSYYGGYDYDYNRSNYSQY